MYIMENYSFQYCYNFHSKHRKNIETICKWMNAKNVATSSKPNTGQNSIIQHLLYREVGEIIVSPSFRKHPKGAALPWTNVNQCSEVHTSSLKETKEKCGRDCRSYLLFIFSEKKTILKDFFNNAMMMFVILFPPNLTFLYLYLFSQISHTKYV